MSISIPGGKRGLYLSIAMSLGSLAVILALTVDEDTIGSVLRLRPGYLALAALMVLVLWLVEGLRIKIIAHTLGYHGKMRMRDAVRIYLVTYFFGGITPLAMAEWPVQIYVLCRIGLTAGESAAVSLVRTFLSKCLLVAAAAFLLFVDGRAANGSGPIFILFRYAFWVLTGTTAFYLLLMWRSGLAQSVLRKLQGFGRFQKLYARKPKLRKFVARLLAEATQFQETVCQINRKNGLHFFLPLLLTVLFWSVFYSIALVLLAGLGVTVDIRSAIAWQIMIMLVIPYIPIPGGSGVAELGVATLFAAFVPSSVLGVFILAWRFFTYYLTLIIGAMLTFSVAKISD